MYYKNLLRFLLDKVTQKVGELYEPKIFEKSAKNNHREVSKNEWKKKKCQIVDLINFNI